MPIRITWPIYHTLAERAWVQDPTHPSLQKYWRVWHRTVSHHIFCQMLPQVKEQALLWAERVPFEDVPLLGYDLNNMKPFIEDLKTQAALKKLVRTAQQQNTDVSPSVKLKNRI